MISVVKQIQKSCLPGSEEEAVCNKDFLCAGIGGLPSPVNEGYKVKKKVTSHELSSFSYTIVYKKLNCNF